MNQTNSTQQVVDQIAAEIAAGYKGEFIAMIVAHVNSVNCNRASAALRKCEKMGLIEVLPNSARGPKVYRVVAPAVKVAAPTFCTTGKWDGIETSFSVFFQSLN